MPDDDGIAAERCSRLPPHGFTVVASNRQRWGCADGKSGQGRFIWDGNRQATLVIDGNATGVYDLATGLDLMQRP